MCSSAWVWCSFPPDLSNARDGSQTTTLAPLLAAVCPEGANSAVMQIHVSVFIQTYCSVSRRVPKQTMSAIKMSNITFVSKEKNWTHSCVASFTVAKKKKSICSYSCNIHKIISQYCLDFWQYLTYLQYIYVLALVHRMLQKCDKNQIDSKYLKQELIVKKKNGLPHWF